MQHDDNSTSDEDEARRRDEDEDGDAGGLPKKRKFVTGNSEGDASKAPKRRRSAQPQTRGGGGDAQHLKPEENEHHNTQSEIQRPAPEPHRKSSKQIVEERKARVEPLARLLATQVILREEGEALLPAKLFIRATLGLSEEVTSGQEWSAVLGLVEARPYLVVRDDVAYVERGKAVSFLEALGQNSGSRKGLRHLLLLEVKDRLWHKEVLDIVNSAIAKATAKAKARAHVTPQLPTTSSPSHGAGDEDDRLADSDEIDARSAVGSSGARNTGEGPAPRKTRVAPPPPLSAASAAAAVAPSVPPPLTAPITKARTKRTRTNREAPKEMRWTAYSAQQSPDPERQKEAQPVSQRTVAVVPSVPPPPAAVPKSPRPATSAAVPLVPPPPAAVPKSPRTTPQTMSSSASAPHPAPQWSPVGVAVASQVLTAEGRPALVPVPYFNSLYSFKDDPSSAEFIRTVAACVRPSMGDREWKVACEALRAARLLVKPDDKLDLGLIGAACLMSSLYEPHGGSSLEDLVIIHSINLGAAFGTLLTEQNRSRLIQLGWIARRLFSPSTAGAPPTAAIGEAGVIVIDAINLGNELFRVRSAVQLPDTLVGHTRAASNARAAALYGFLEVIRSLSTILNEDPIP